MKKESRTDSRKSAKQSHSTLKGMSIDLKPWGKRWRIKIEAKGYQEGQSRYRKSLISKATLDKPDWNHIVGMAEHAYENFFKPAY